MEHLTLRAEAGAWPFWDNAEGDCVDPESFDIPPDLLAELTDWTDRLSDVDGWFEDEATRVAFDEQGRQLWARLVPVLRGQATLGWRASFSKDEARPDG